MTLRDIKTKFGIETIQFNQWKEDGSFMATIINPTNNASIELFTTKATGNKFTLDSPVSIFGGKFYVGEVKKAIASKTL